MPPQPRTAATAATLSGAIEVLRSATERGDADAVTELLAPKVSFHSPLTSRARFEGRDEVVALLRDVFAVLDNIQTDVPLAGDQTRAFRFSASVRNVELGAVLYAIFDDRGLITEITVFGRPLPGAATLFAALPPRVSARRRGRMIGATVGILARPLALTIRAVDRCVPWFL